ncbi:O-antigen ligase family protein [Blastococcus haudaquaticus]|uniref:O-antigen ligase n=1 Tax=Blastococcus haudaquaticus TaxID=1938745 RepID=A0A286GZ43_9ACTN|nr:O-antigen ligase family protein [Blastococcus haudaquaticus]SOE00369.1 O-antigen ligase [Blastococcus haudaquaticus]
MTEHETVKPTGRTLAVATDARQARPVRPVHPLPPSPDWRYGSVDTPPLSTRLALCIAGTAFLFAATGRGVLESFGPKLVAYAVQFALLGAALVVLFAVGRPERRQPRRGTSAVAYAAIIVFVTSSIVTAMGPTGSSGLVYVIVMTFYLGLFWAFSSFRFAHIGYWINSSTLAAITITIVIVALFQQYTSLFGYLPGNDTFSVAGYIRPASITGSYLHYPLALAVLLFPLFQYSARRSTISFLVGAIGTVALVLSLSRSGLLILIGGCLVWLLVRRAWVPFATLSLFFAVLALLPVTWSQNAYLERVLDAGSLSASGNTGRVALWQQGWEMWLDSPLLVGGYVGVVTNAASNLGGGSGIIVESGLLQQMLNFGLLGAGLFYLVLLSGTRRIDRSHAWLISGLIAAAVESVFYQSIEVLPYMALLSVYPAVSDSIRTGRSGPAADAAVGSEAFNQEENNARLGRNRRTA